MLVTRCDRFVPVAGRFALVARRAGMTRWLCFSAGPVHWQPAEPGAQPAVGRGGGLPARVRAHADEAVPGRSPPPAAPHARLETGRRQTKRAFLCSNTVVLRLVPYASFTFKTISFKRTLGKLRIGGTVIQNREHKILRNRVHGEIKECRLQTLNSFRSCIAPPLRLPSPAPGKAS